MSYRILVVDDDNTGLTLMESRLKKEGYDVFKAATGEEAMEVLKLGETDLVILDVEMPGMNGYMVVYEMRKIEALRNTPVIVLTSHEENRKIFARTGIANYMVKPVNFDQLFPLMAKMLTQPPASA